MKKRLIHPSTILRGRRGTMLVVIGALVLGLGVMGFSAAVAGGPSSQRKPVAPAVRAQQVPQSHPARLSPRLSPTPEPTTEPTTEPTPEPTVDPNALADGIYPTFVRGVDVRGATITVDVLQTFFGADARRAALEDGVSWRDVRYDPVYIRNENPLLRTLPVASDVQIKLIGVCIAPDRRVGLMQLRTAITPFTEEFYYDVSVVSGTVERIQQLVAIAGC